MHKFVEICVESAEGAIAAGRGGADRVELCANRALGGVTPEPAEIARGCRELTVPVHVLIRPRAGDFRYSSEELARMTLEIAVARSLGAAGVVLGVLSRDCRVDRRATADLVAFARPLCVTFHKAFDCTPDPFEALESLIALKIDRVLTSGQAATARAGGGLLKELVRLAAGRITILAGGGIGLDDLPMIRAAGPVEIHAGSSVESNGRTDEALVRRLVQAWGNSG